MSRPTSYQSALYNSPGAAQDAQASGHVEAMQLVAPGNLKAGPLQNLKTGLESSRAAGARDRTIANYVAQREADLAILSAETSFQLAAKALTDVSASSLAAMDQRLLIKEHGSKVGLLNAFSTGLAHQSQALSAAQQLVLQDVDSGRVSRDRAEMMLGRLSAADVLISQSHDRALVGTLEQTESRFAAARSTR